MMIHAVVLAHGILLGVDPAHQGGNPTDVIGKFLLILYLAKMILKKKRRVDDITGITDTSIVITEVQVEVQVEVVIIHNV